MSKHPYISPDEVTQLFHHSPKRRKALTWPIISAAFLLGLGVYILTNAPAVSQQLSYWWETDIQAAKQVNQSMPTFTSSPNTTVPVNGSTPAQTSATSFAFDPAQMPDNSLAIPKLKIKAPIVWDVSAGGDLNSDMLKALERGVARYPQTALPDQVGNVFLTGHSSNYWWEKGQYKTVFALLNRLVAGDLIYVKYQGVVYTYKVNGQKVVKPTETSVLNPTTKPILSLMTCTPTGTALNRRIVTADLVAPKDNLKPQPTQPSASSLQSVR